LIKAEDMKGAISGEIQRPFPTIVIKFMNKKGNFKPDWSKIKSVRRLKKFKSVLLNIKNLTKEIIHH